MLDYVHVINFRIIIIIIIIINVQVINYLPTDLLVIQYRPNSTWFTGALSICYVTHKPLI